MTTGIYQIYQTHHFFVKLFNLIFEARTIRPVWCQSLISPIFKSDDKLNPENYRPICVTSCFCKLFFLLLNERLTIFLTENRIISPCQIGFQNKARTIDHIFCLKSLVNKFVHNTERGEIYACFVDFKKVHDTVWQEGSFTKLECFNVNGCFLDIIKDMYSKSSCAVKIGNKSTNFFRCKKRCTPRVPFKPKLIQYLLDNGTDISCLLYAGDIVIMPHSEGLQKCLDELNKFFSMKLIKKTKCMTFQKQNKVNKKSSLFIDGKVVQNVSEFTCLGVNIKMQW